MSDRVTEQIRAVADCREILRAKLAGYKGRGNAKCLWHDDRQASLQVESDHAFCHSPGCEAHQRLDCFSIVMMIEGCTFPEAKTWLADFYHISGNGNGANRAERRSDARSPQPSQDAENERKSFPSLDAALEKYRPLSVYRYEHPDGSLNHCELKVKSDKGKLCLPLHEEPDGIWYLDLQNVTRTLYGLPELLESDPDSWVIFTEGAKDCDCVRSLGFVAVTSGSSGSLGAANRDGALEPLRGRKIALFADQDKAGETMEEKAREILPEIVRELRIVQLPNAEEIKGYDLSDFVTDVGEDDACGLIMELIEGTRPEPVKKEQKPQNKATTPVTISFHDLSQAEIEEPRMIVEQILSEGLALWCGAPKSCKSWQMIQMATAVSQGGLFLGEFRCTQGDVLCLSLEDNERRLAKRLKMQLQGDQAPHNAYLATQWPMFRETKRNEIDGLGHLHRFIENHPETRLVIIDTLAKVRPRRKKEGNLYGQDYEDLEQLQQMASLYGIAIVLVHHLNKGQHQDEFNTISGSTGLSGCADTVAILRKPRGATEGELFISGRDVEEIRGSLSFDPDTGLWAWNGTVAEAKSSQERGEILAVMKAVGSPMKPKDVHEKLGGTRTLNAIQQAMTRMRSAGSLESSARGKGWYVVAPPPFPTH